MSGVKLDVSINWITNIQDLQKEVRNVNTRLSRITRSFNKDYTSSPLLERIRKETLAMKQYDNIFNKVYADLDKLNKKGELSQYLGTMFTGRWNQKKLNPKQLEQLAYVKTEEEIERISKQQEHDDETAKRIAQNENKAKLQIEKDKESKFQERLRLFIQGSKERFSDDLRAKKQERKNQEAEARKIMGEEKWNKKMNILHSRALEDNKKRDEALRKKQLMMMLGKWGKLGVWGLVAQQAIKYISKAVGYAYATSMQGLSWERTIRGGASGGNWFGKDIAAFERAGIKSDSVQNFKRNLLGYIGSVKLGMGNAAPLMYLGLNALDSPDKLQGQLEKSLRRLPKDVSFALASQMGLDYDMWESIYSGRVDRSKTGYKGEAISKWAELADSINNLIVNLKTFTFNHFAPYAEAFSKYLNMINKGGSDMFLGSLGVLGQLASFLNPAMFLGAEAGKALRGELEILIKNEKGETIETRTVKINNDALMEIPN